MIKIEFGNPNKRESWTTVDIRGTPDIKHDLNILPYPFKDNSADEINVFHLLEHLDNPKATIMEFHRILKDGGTLTIKVPYGNTKMKNPSHLHNFLPEWFMSFEKDNSPYNNETIGGMFSIMFNITEGKFKFWKCYEIVAYMQKVTLK